MFLILWTKFQTPDVLKTVSGRIITEIQTSEFPIEFSFLSFFMLPWGKWIIRSLCIN